MKKNLKEMSSEELVKQIKSLQGQVSNAAKYKNQLTALEKQIEEVVQQKTSMLEQEKQEVMLVLKKTMELKQKQEEWLDELLKVVMEFTTKWKGAKGRRLKRFFLAVEYMDDFEKLFTELIDKYWEARNEQQNDNKG